MKISFFILCALFSSIYISAQSISGRVVNTKGEGIPYVTIGVKGKNRGTYSFEDGTFKVDLTGVDQNDWISFSSVGYEALSIPIADMRDQIVLMDAVIPLQAIIVRPSNPKRFGLFKKKSSSDIAIDQPYNGAEVAVLIDLPPKDSLRINSLFINLVGSALDSIRIRARIYSVENERPKEMIHQSQIFSFPRQDGIVELTLSTELIIAGPVFLSFEWLVDKKMANKMSVQYEVKKELIDSLRRQYEGAVSIYNDKRVEVSDAEGNILQAFKLDRKSIERIKVSKKNIPQLKFKTANENTITVYRAYSLGKWYPYQQSLIAGLEGLKY